MINFDVLTLFPEMFSPLNASIIGRACDKGLVDFNIVNIRDFTDDKNGRVDDTPYGGGHGMVLRAQPVCDAVSHTDPEGRKRALYMSPRGRMLDKELLSELADEPEILILCGHYEGIDQRALDICGFEEISIGDYILTGGELPAMVLIDALTRLVPGALSDGDAATEESVYSGLLEYPQYTKPRQFRGYEVPKVLTSGDHGKVDAWRLEQALELTENRRNDLYEKYKVMEKDREKL